MQICIVSNDDPINGRLAGTQMPPDRAKRNFDLAILQAQDQVRNSYGKTEEEWELEVGSDFETTGVSDLSTSELTKAIMRLITAYLTDLAKGGEITVLENQKRDEYQGIDSGDFEEMD